ncbi:hypothetical protein LMG28138_03544 [Pararobbsia alpina]|uniref:Uncharacterized protein n=1 Tax=Pararobbsia alpina TaxID=621374 RepID=A0A6S7D1E7_9BURK|nr:hypothetical protein LMG28138_03544 [Pararobbsia alpina]
MKHARKAGMALRTRQDDLQLNRGSTVNRHIECAQAVRAAVEARDKGGADLLVFGMHEIGVTVRGIGKVHRKAQCRPRARPSGDTFSPASKLLKRMPSTRPRAVSLSINSSHAEAGISGRNLHSTIWRIGMVSRSLAKWTRLESTCWQKPMRCAMFRGPKGHRFMRAITTSCGLAVSP